MRRSLFAIVPALAIMALLCTPMFIAVGAETAAPLALWISQFEDGRPITEVLPESIVQTDCATLSDSLSGKPVQIVIIDAGGSGFESVALGIYDTLKRDVEPLWASHLAGTLPFVIKNLNFDDIFIKYTYLPGDKYVSCNFKICAAGSVASSGANLMLFRVEDDLDFAGYSLKEGDFLLAGDSGGDGTLSSFSNGDYSDIVFVLRSEHQAEFPLWYAFGAFGAGLIWLGWWSFRRGKHGLQK